MGFTWLHKHTSLQIHHQAPFAEAIEHGKLTNLFILTLLLFLPSLFLS